MSKSCNANNYASQNILKLGIELLGDSRYIIMCVTFDTMHIYVEEGLRHDIVQLDFNFYS